MQSLEKAIDRIKLLECPTGDLENRVEKILESYNVANKNEITVKRNEHLDRIGAQAYSATISNGEQKIVILAKSGLDDYVTTVVDAYIQ